MNTRDESHFQCRSEDISFESNEDMVFIHGLRLNSIIGIDDDEQFDSQTLIVDVEVFPSNRNAHHSDDIRDAINYAKIRELLINIAANHKFKLLEALAALMINKIFEFHQVERARVKLYKPKKFDDTDACGVILDRKARLF